MTAKLYTIICRRCSKELTLEVSAELMKERGTIRALMDLLKGAGFSHLTDDKCSGPICFKDGSNPWSSKEAA